MRLSEMRAKVKQATIDYDGETVDFGYKPGEITLDLMDSVQEKADSGDKTSVALLLEPMLDWWDVLDESDERLPTDAATIRQMPMAFLTALMQKMTGEIANPPA